MSDDTDAGGVAAEGLAAETELKFELRSADLRRLSKHPAFEQEPRVQRLVSTYFDTPGCELRKAGLSLRVREVGGGYVQTVKRGRLADLFDRDEWEAGVSGNAPEQKALDCTPAARTLRKAEGELLPVFTTDIERATRLWATADAVIEISIDNGEIKAGSGREVLSEVELELKAGEPAALYRLARELFELAPIRLSLTTKGERGYRLAAPGASLRAPYPPLTAQMSVVDAFSAVLRSCLVHVAAAAEDFRRNESAEGVHQTRVGLRRTRTAMKIFKAAATDGRSAWLEGEIRWLAGELGDARSLDVFKEEVYRPEAVSDPKAGARLGDQLEKNRTAAYERVKAALESDRFSKLMLELALWVEDGDWRGAREPERAAALSSPIGGFAVDALDHLRKVIRRRGEHLQRLEPERRHKLRIRAKRLRYATEFFARAFGEHGRRQRRFAGALKALQTTLGRLQDIATVGATAHLALKGSVSPPLHFAAGELVGQVRAGEPKVLAEAAEAYEEFAGAKPYWSRRDVEEPTHDGSDPAL